MSKDLALALLNHLRREITAFRSKGLEDEAESLEVACDCINSTYKLEDYSPANGTPEISLSYGQSGASATLLASLQSKETGSTASKFDSMTEEEKHILAETHKKEGNKKMSELQYAEAVEQYSQAIKLWPSSSSYFGNRAAAYTYLKQHDLAIEDSYSALRIDPSYTKAYGRLGVAYAALNKTEKALEAYREALKSDPGNQSYKTSIENLEKSISEPPPKAAAPAPAASANPFGAGGMPNFGNLFGGGGMPDIASLMSNPALMNMAQSVMSNPAMMSQMMGSMANNPAMASMMGGLGNMMGGLGNNNGSPASPAEDEEETD